MSKQYCCWFLSILETVEEIYINIELYQSRMIDFIRFITEIGNHINDILILE